MEKKLQKLAKTFDYLERAKREESAPLIEAAYQRSVVEGRVLDECVQQQEIELSRQQHDGDLKEKERLARMKMNKEILQERFVSCRQAEFNRLKEEREEQISRILQSRKQERERMRKFKYYMQLEEERQRKLQEEEELRRHEEAEKLRREEAERKAKLDEIAEKQRQRQRELEEKERLRKEALLGRITETLSKPSEPPAAALPLEPGSAVPATAAAASAAASPGRYFPKFKRERAESSGQAPPAQPDWWGSSRRQHERAESSGLTPPFRI